MRRELFVPLILAGLTIAFTLASLLVHMSRGNSAYLIRKKLKLGALILTLTAAGCQDPVGTTTCYLPARPDPVDVIALINTGGSGHLTLDLDETNILTGTIAKRRSSVFSFMIVKPDLTEIQRSEVAAQDGAFDEETEEIAITIDPDLAPGSYLLSVWGCAAMEIETHVPLDTFALDIVGGK